MSIAKFRRSVVEGESDVEDPFLGAGELLDEDLKRTPPPSDSDTSSMNEEQSLVFSNNRNVQNSSDKVPLWKKVTFAIGAMPYAMCSTVLGFYFNIFLLEVVILNPVYVLIILFSGRIWDAVTDPIVGYLTSLTKTRFGRLRPWLAMSMVPSGVLYFFLFYVPPLDDYPQYWKYIYYQTMYLLYEASLSCIHVPYTALTVHISNNSKERDLTTAIRMSFEVLSTLIGIGVYTLFYSIFVVGSLEDDCDDEERVPSKSLRKAFQWHALFLGFLTVLFVSITVFTIREQEDEMRVTKRIGFFRGLKDVWTFKPYVYLVIFTVMGWLALQFIQGNMALYSKYSLGLEKEYTYTIIVLILSTVCCVAFWQFIIVKFGKKTAYFCALWSLFPLLLSQLYLNYVPRLSYVFSLLAGFGVAAAYLMPWSMLPDVIDESILKYSIRREELFYAYFVFGNKFGSGFTLATSTAVLKLIGYNEQKCEQPWLVPLAMKLIVTVPPILFILCGLPFLWLYPVNEKTRARVKAALMERRSRKSSNFSNGDALFNGPTSVAAARHEVTSMSEEVHDSPSLHSKTLSQSHF